MAANPDQTTVLLGGLVVGLATILWLIGHGIGAVLYTRRAKGAEAPSKLSIAAWIIGAIGGFTGPFVILFNLVAFAMGIIELISVKTGASPRASRLPAGIAVATSSIILLMAVFLVVVMTMFA